MVEKPKVPTSEEKPKSILGKQNEKPTGPSKINSIFNKPIQPISQNKTGTYSSKKFCEEMAKEIDDEFAEFIDDETCIEKIAGLFKELNDNFEAIHSKYQPTEISESYEEKMKLYKDYKENKIQIINDESFESDQKLAEIFNNSIKPAEISKLEMKEKEIKEFKFNNIPHSSQCLKINTTNQKPMISIKVDDS